VTRHVPALVVGGGISGLVCAYALRKAGIDAHLVEASSRPGGVIQSVSREGFLLELGPQSFSGVPSLRDLCSALEIENQLVQAPRAPRFVLINGVLQHAPLSPLPFFASSFVGFGTKWAILRDAFGRSAPPAQEESVAAFVRRKFSSELLEKLVGPFVSGIYAGDPEKLSLRAAFPQLHEAETTTGSIVRGVARHGKQIKQSGKPRPALISFRDGNDTLPRALAAKIGSALHLNTQVKSIQIGSEPNEFVLNSILDGAEQTFTTENLILATPTAISAALLANLSSNIETHLNAVEYAPVAVVSLGYRKQDVGHSLNGFGFLVPRSAGPRTLGTIWNSSLFPARAPEGHVLLTSFIGGALDPSAITLPTERLLALAHSEIAPLLSIRNNPVLSHISPYTRAIPQYNLGHTERLSALANELRRFPNLWLTGNYLHGPAVGACVEHARLVAQQVVQRAVR
jgi:protoporphyrinogen/coproporphyrinogen III oxidase